MADGHVTSSAARGLRKLAQTVVIGLALLSALNALFIGGVPIALTFGYHVFAKPVEALVLAAGVPDLFATLALWTTVSIFWAVTTIPGLLIWD